MSQNLGIDEGTGRKLACDDITLHAETASRQAVMELWGTIQSDRATCATAGTREQFKTGSTPCRKVDITAELDNTGVVVVGGAACVAALATRKGAPLEPGDSLTVYVTDLSLLYLDAVVSTDGVTYNYFT